MQTASIILEVLADTPTTHRHHHVSSFANSLDSFYSPKKEGSQTTKMPGHNRLTSDIFKASWEGSRIFSLKHQQLAAHIHYANGTILPLLHWSLQRHLINKNFRYADFGVEESGIKVSSLPQCFHTSGRPGSYAQDPQPSPCQLISLVPQMLELLEHRVKPCNTSSPHPILTFQ